MPKIQFVQVQFKLKTGHSFPFLHPSLHPFTFIQQEALSPLISFLPPSHLLSQYVDDILFCMKKKRIDFFYHFFLEIAQRIVAFEKKAPGFRGIIANGKIRHLQLSGKNAGNTNGSMLRLRTILMTTFVSNYVFNMTTIA